MNDLPRFTEQRPGPPLVDERELQEILSRARRCWEVREIEKLLLGGTYLHAWHQ